MKEGQVMESISNIIALVLLWCKQNNVRITNARLQKFLYLIQLEYAKEHKQCLISEAFCCWQYGPTIPAVYYEYQIYGAEEIPVNIDKLKVNANYAVFVCKTMEKYGHLSTSDLIRLCHDSEPYKYVTGLFGYNTYIPQSCYL